MYRANGGDDSSMIPQRLSAFVSPYQPGLGDNPLIDTVGRTACPDITTQSPIDVSLRGAHKTRYLAIGKGDLMPYTSYAGENWTANPSGLGLDVGAIVKSGASGATVGSAGGPIGSVVSAVVSIAANVLGQLGRKVQPSDPLEAITDKIPPSAINASVGADGWWYDNDDNHKLSHQEASIRQHQVGAAAIGASVGNDGWWYDNADNHKLTHAEAWERYQTLVRSGGNYAGSPSTGGINIEQNQVTWSPAQTPGGTTVRRVPDGGAAPRAPVVQAAGIPGGTMGIILILAVLGAALVSSRKSR